MKKLENFLNDIKAMSATMLILSVINLLIIVFSNYNLEMIVFATILLVAFLSLTIYVSNIKE